MVRGIDKFKEYFTGYEECYIVIGGTACDILEENAGQRPRATKDIDIILIVEALSRHFVKRFWDFIKAGRYQSHQRGNGKHEYFRFLKPQNDDYPFQIEIFSRKPDILEIAKNTRLTPVSVDEDLSSLSAILMNDSYYYFTLEHSIIQDGIRIANIESLIILKAKAYIDMSERKALDMVVDEKNIRKHKNDIFRLATLLTPLDTFTLPPDLQKNMENFCRMVSQSVPDSAFFKSIGLSVIPEKIFNLLCNSFQIKLTWT
jgi:hypothetical protein